MDEPASPITDADTSPPPADTGFEPAEPLKSAGAQFEPEGDGAAPGTRQQIKEGAQKLSATANDKVRFFAGQGKDKATDALAQLSQMLTDAAAQVDDKLGAQYGDYARNAAGQVQGFADTVGNKSVDDLLDDARELVRKSPGVAIGTAAAVGFVIARLLSSGLEQRDA